MARIRGAQCRVVGGSKRKKLGEHKDRSDSEGASDEESVPKRKFSRTFHQSV